MSVKYAIKTKYWILSIVCLIMKMFNLAHWLLMIYCICKSLFCVIWYLDNERCYCCICEIEDCYCLVSCAFHVANMFCSSLCLSSTVFLWTGGLQVGKPSKSKHNVLPRGSLQFKSLTKEDHGEWECVATNVATSITASTHVQVIGTQRVHECTDMRINTEIYTCCTIRQILIFNKGSLISQTGRQKQLQLSSWKKNTSVTGRFH